MARIPVPVTGSVVARPGAQPNVPQGSPVGAALQQVGNVINNIAGDMRAVQVQQEREQEAVKQAAARAEAQSTLGAARDQLADLHDAMSNDILTGAIPKDDAEKTWAERSKEVGAAALSNITDPLQRTVAQTDIDGLSARLGNRLRRSVETRGRQDVTAGIEQTLEHYSRQYNGDPAGTTAFAMQTVDQLAPFSDKPPTYWQGKKQAWRESTQYTAGFELVNAAKNDPKLLTAAETVLATERFADLDPQRRAVLVNQIDGHRTRLAQEAEVRAARAQRLADASLRRAGAEFETFQALADKGGALSPEYIDRVMKATAGTPYAAGVSGLLQQVREVGGLAAQPIATQQATLDAINAHIVKNGRSPELDKRKEQVEKVLKGSQQDYAADPLRAAQERGLIELQPLAMSGGLPGILQQIQTRVTQADTIAPVAGRAVSPLLQSEADQVSRMLASLPTDQKAQSLAMLSTAVGPRQAQAIAAQVDKSDRALSLAMKLGASQTTVGLPASRLLLLGQQALKDKGSKEGDKAPGKVLEAAAKEVGNAVSGQVRDDAIESAALIFTGMQADGQNASMANAVRIAIGGPIIQHNGQRLPVPAGVTPDRMRDQLGSQLSLLERQLPDGKVYSTAGQPVAASQFLADLPQAELLPAGLGRYYVRSGAGVALNAKGEKITIEVR